MTLEFTVPGQPQGKGRPRFARRGNFVSTYTDKATKGYEAMIKECYAENYSHCHDTTEPIRMTVTAYYHIPSSFSLKKKNEAIKGKLRPLTKPDLDNIGKIVADSLNGVAYMDDKQIVEMVINKFYGEHPRLEIMIENLTQGG